MQENMQEQTAVNFLDVLVTAAEQEDEIEIMEDEK